jgi:hypothetical protein
MRKTKATTKPMAKGTVHALEPKAPRARTARRAAEQQVRRLVRKLDRLQEDLPGGAPARPLAVTSASVVEVRARAERCLACQGELTLGAHEADGPADRQLRRVDLVCAACRRPRRLWFRIEAPVTN